MLKVIFSIYVDIFFRRIMQYNTESPFKAVVNYIVYQSSCFQENSKVFEALQ